MTGVETAGQILSEIQSLIDNGTTSASHALARQELIEMDLWGLEVIGSGTLAVLLLAAYGAFKLVTGVISTIRSVCRGKSA